MGLKITCDACGRGVAGVFSSLRKVNGKYLCPTCAENPNQDLKYYCNSCSNYSATARKKGSGWIELVLYLFYIVPGIIYSIWRRSGPPNVCPTCKSATLIPAAAAKPRVGEANVESRAERDCPYCAEKILVKASLCKHCGKAVA